MVFSVQKKEDAFLIALTMPKLKNKLK